jgi:SAM-dependent methyltransferase
MRGGERIEITDLLAAVGPGGAPRPLKRDALVEECLAHGDRWGARIVGALPERDGWLDDAYVDRLLVTVHCEIQRLSEEFRHGARMAAHLRAVLAGLRGSGCAPPYRVVDVGCGTGYVVRWLAANLREVDVELVGVDLNPALIDAARKLASDEALPCRFEVADAFALEEPATVIISTGLMHHFRGNALGDFFVAHERASAAAFVHIDFQPSPIAPLGAWLFHKTRMRLGIARHDGVRSAQRAHSTDLLERAAASGAPHFDTRLARRNVRFTPLPCVLTTLIGTRRDLSQVMPGSLGDGHFEAFA